MRGTLLFRTLKCFVLETVYSITAYLLSNMACLASSPGSSRHTVVCADGAALVVMGQLGNLHRIALKNIIRSCLSEHQKPPSLGLILEYDADGLGGDAGVGVILLHHFADV
eukprot:g27991.t1